MQAYNGQGEIVGAATGTLENVIKKSAEELERERVAKVIIGKIPQMGGTVEIGGLLYEVTFVAPKRGKVNLKLIGVRKDVISPEGGEPNIQDTPNIQ